MKFIDTFSDVLLLNYHYLKFVFLVVVEKVDSVSTKPPIELLLWHLLGCLFLSIIWLLMIYRLAL